jgi:hypothetical protein
MMRKLALFVMVETLAFLAVILFVWMVVLP